MGALANRVFLGVVILFIIIVGRVFVTTYTRQDRTEIQKASENVTPPREFKRIGASDEGSEHLNTENDYSQTLKTAKEVRQRLNQPPGIFLGTGFIPDFFQNMSLIEAQMLFHGHIINAQYKCQNIKRFGHQGDGGYDVCVDDSFAPKKNNCLVYSFGIRNEWSFDDAINSYFGCDVYSFDPSMGQKDHKHKEPNMYYYNLGIWGSNLKNADNWELRDLETIIKMLGHENRVIDYLKIDVEGAEWPLVTHLIKSGVLKQIKQMALELHTPRLKVNHQPMSVIDYAEIYHGLSTLHTLGFKKFLYHSSNGCCGRFVELTPANVQKTKKLCCYETFYVNGNFIK